jgi:hypothetical protein
MRLEAKKYLFDIERAASLIAEFVSGKRRNRVRKL